MIENITVDMFRMYLMSRTTTFGKSRGGSGVEVASGETGVGFAAAAGHIRARFVSSSQLNIDRSAFMDWYDKYSIPRPQSVRDGLRGVMSAALRVNASERQKSGKALAPGTKPLEVDTYYRCHHTSISSVAVRACVDSMHCRIGLECLKASGCSVATAARYFEAACFQALTWNLSCRAASSIGLAFPHIEWENDCFKIMLAKHKVRFPTRGCAPLLLM